ncbi:hypothetical protein [Microcoleus sp. BROC3]|uniref:hypothetical protein n=1 Tax=Microcoleus sp. BROC3 TaxID=3055323 RepID=UPI002FD69A68
MVQHLRWKQLTARALNLPISLSQPQVFLLLCKAISEPKFQIHLLTISQVEPLTTLFLPFLGCAEVRI